MDKVTWGASQAITSLLFFLIQLSFLKSHDLLLMALFSTLFGLLNFCLLAIRRSLIEVNKFDNCTLGIVFSVAISFVFCLFCIPISILIGLDFLILFCMTLFLFNQLVLDTWRFSGSQSHNWYIAAQAFSAVLTVGLSLTNLSASQIVLIISLFQFVLCMFSTLREKRVILNLRSSLALFNLTRFFDFTINSGFGFFLPLLTFIFLNANAVGALRTSQNILTLGSIFTSAFYYSTIMGQDVKKIPKLLYFVPSLILFGLLFVLIVFVPPSFVEQVFGPFFYESIPLTILLIVALVPTIWVSTMYAVLVNSKDFRFLFKTHSISLMFLSVGSSAGFFFFGVEAYGFFAIFCVMLEAFLIVRFLNPHRGQEIEGYNSRTTSKKK